MSVIWISTFTVMVLLQSQYVWGACTSDVTISGYGDVTTIGSTSIDTNTGYSYIMELAYYQVPDTCTCGLLKSWKFYAHAGGTIDLQVWRRTNHLVYTLVGENTFTVPAAAAGNVIEYTVPDSDRITVITGDYLGWYMSGSDIIGYTDGGADYPDDIKYASTTDFAEGATFDWNAGSVNTFPNRAYGIQATVGQDTTPGFSNLPRSVILYQDWVSPTQIYVVSYTDVDPDDVSVLYTTYDTSPLVFNYSSSTQAITLAQSQPSVGSTTVTLSVYDQCGNSASGNLDLEVKNLKPSITNLPASTTVDEMLTERTLLQIVTVTDDVDISFSDTTTISPNSNIQLVQTGTNGFSFYSIQGASYDYNVNQYYEAKTIISDGTDTVFGYYLVYVNKNDPPVFTNLNKGAQATVSYLSTKNGDVVYSVTATDTESDPLTISIACDPAGCPLAINNAGVITTTSDMIRTYVPGYDITVSLQDGYTTVEDRKLTVLVNDIDDKPVITNLPLDYAIMVYEDTAIATTIFTVSYNDLDTTDTVTITAQYDNPSGENYFHLDSTSGVLTTATRVIDYEDIPDLTYVLTITVSDGQDSATATLSISIGNINEPPSFHQTMYKVLVPETGSAGNTAVTPSFTVNDEDNDRTPGSDSHFYSWNCATYTKYFVMVRNSGVIQYASDFDLDTVGISSNIFNCTVTVTDTGGLSATTYLHVEILDTNDHTPTFSQSVDYYIFAVPTLGSDRYVGQTLATDGDYTTVYNTIYYSIDLSPLTDSFVYINSYGNIYVNETWDTSIFYYGAVHTFVVKAQDIDRQSSTATVTLILAATTTDAPVTTDRPKFFIGDSRNVAWVIPTSVFGALLVVAVCLLLLAYTKTSKQFRWLPPWCRKRVVLVDRMIKRIRREKYKEKLRKEKEDEVQVMESSTDTGSDTDVEEQVITRTKLQSINLVQETQPPLPKKAVRSKPKWT